MKTLNRKVLRNLWSLRGPGTAIALVIAAGVAVFVMALSTLDSLERTRSLFYQDYRFADVFAELKRAPDRTAGALREISGVAQVQTRVMSMARLEVPDFEEPVRGQLVSLPDGEQPALNQLYLREGRLPGPTGSDEIVISDGFAEAHELETGDRLTAIMNGRRRAFRIVGIALSPEFILQVAPGALFPDYQRFGVFWLRAEVLEGAYDMEGAFNSVTLDLAPDASEDAVIDRVDEALAPYGSPGAYARADQQSHFYLSEEMRQLNTFATLLPVIFLGVAAFLLNVVVGRLIQTDREEIAILKAFGYSNADVGVHYAKLVGAIVVLGSAAGIGLGAWLGEGMAGMYQEFYRFPFLAYELPLYVVAAGLGVAAVAATVGGVRAIRSAVALPPAEAMRPEPPARYEESFIERLGLKDVFSQPTRMIARHLERHPVKSALSVVGIALGCSLLIMGRFSRDSIEYLVEVQFEVAQQEDLTVSFVEPTSRDAAFELAHVPGVRRAEPMRSVAVRLRSGHRSRRTSISGIDPDGVLHRVLDEDLDPVELPPAGILMNRQLARTLGVEPGDSLTVEVMEGTRPTRTVQVARLIEQYMGTTAYMSLPALQSLIGPETAISGVRLATAAGETDAVKDRITGRPRVAAIQDRTAAIADFYDAVAENWFIVTFFVTLFAVAIAFAVVYNTARISLSERSRELASLRVLGFTRREISYILLGELAVLTLVAIPVGFLFGRLLVGYIVQALQTELYRIPFVVQPSTYAYAAVVVIASAAVSALVARRRLNNLDLVEVLKTRE